MRKDPRKWLSLSRTVHFGDVDAAGVVHFHNLLRWCHESWEQSLQAFGVSPQDVFPTSRINGDYYPLVALPITHCEADFRLPIKNGDQLKVFLAPQKIDFARFQIETKFFCRDEYVAIGLLRHVAINSQTRKRTNLPEQIDTWLELSSVNMGVREV